MSHIQTARDASLSLWQSAVEAVVKELDPSVSNSDQTNPMNVATGLYIATANPDDTSSEEQATTAFAEALGAGVIAGAGDMSDLSALSDMSALYHSLGDAIVSNNSRKERLIREQIEETKRKRPGISIVDWSKPLIEYVRYYEKQKGQPQYRSWKVEGNNDLNYSVIDWKLPSDARVAIIADWGTGSPEAVNVLRAACALKPHAVIHLGDIYFSGNEQECRDKFLNLMRTYAVDENGTPLPVFTLAGNHDYYSGGAGFLWLLDQLNSGAQSQSASYFCLRSEDGAWQFLAGDTGYNDHSFNAFEQLLRKATYLRSDEADWHAHKLKTFGGSTILLTHHQAFSANEKIGSLNIFTDNPAVNERLIGVFKDYLDRIPLWLWGHEHRLMIYGDNVQGVRKGRCVGNGAIPVDFSAKAYDSPKYPKIPFDKTARPGQSGGKFNQGFALIQLHGTRNPLEAAYYEVFDDTHANEGYGVREVRREEGGGRKEEPRIA